MQDSVQPREWVRRRLEAWLTKSNPTPQELYRFLSGEDQPPIGSAQEPHEWILDAVRMTEREIRGRLIQVMAAALTEEPEISVPERDRKQILYNLMALCSQLPEPTTLGPGLRKMLDRKKLDGDYQGVLLRGRLRAALVANQYDRELSPVWADMVRGRTDFLPGSSSDGFLGVLQLPLVNGDPDRAILGEALRDAAVHVGGSEPEEVPDRIPRFQVYLKSVCRTHVSTTQWDAEFPELAHTRGWPRWTWPALNNFVFVEMRFFLIPASIGQGLNKSEFGQPEGKPMWDELVLPFRPTERGKEVILAVRDAFTGYYGRAHVKSPGTWLRAYNWTVGDTDLAKQTDVDWAGAHKAFLHQEFTKIR